MSLEESSSYFYLDSLCEMLNGPDQLDSLVNRMSSLETLRRLLKIDYLLKNYNVQEFYDYLVFAEKPTYKVRPSAVISTIESRAADVLPDNQLKYVMLASAAAILHIRVAGTWADIDTHALSFNPFRVICVNSLVLDAIKGKHLSVETCSENANSNSVEPTCFKFMYPPMWEKGPGRMGGIQFATADSAGWPTNCSTCYGKDAFISGREYLVVLKNISCGYDGVNALQNYLPYNYLEPSGGIFPIVQGNVVDQNNFWGYGQNVPVHIFKTCLEQEINLLLQP